MDGQLVVSLFKIKGGKNGGPAELVKYVLDQGKGVAVHFCDQVETTEIQHDTPRVVFFGNEKQGRSVRGRRGANETKFEHLRDLRFDQGAFGQGGTIGTLMDRGRGSSVNDQGR